MRGEGLHMKTLYFGGAIYTMETTEPVEALLTENGVVVGAGTRAQLAERARGAEEVQLDGRTVLPAFLDAHSHFSGTAQALLQAPLDEAVNFEEIRQALADFIRENKVPQGTWVTGKGYDHNLLDERCHPTRALLDAVSTDHPIVIVHQSGHMGVFNTLGLKLLGVTADTPVPAGGKIAVENGAPTGYMEESAFISYQQKLPMPGITDLLEAYRGAQQKYASFGITTVQEGMMPEALVPMYQALQAQDLLQLDVVAYPAVDALDAVCAAFPQALRQYDGHIKIGGCKMFLDGSPQGRTAWMRTPYQNATDGYCGYPTMTDAQVQGALATAHEHNMQLLAHCNGDAAAAQYLRETAAFEQAHPDFAALRPVMIHAQLLDLDQMDAVKQTGMILSFFVAHVYRWGDVHIRNFGLERASRISAAKAALDRGIPFTFHQDTPVLPPDMLDTVCCAVTRMTKDGVLLGAEQRISVQDALRAVTSSAAYQYFEETRKGTLAPGKAADLVLLDRDPFAVPAEQLREIRVLETIKEGKTIYRA